MELPFARHGCHSSIGSGVEFIRLINAYLLVSPHFPSFLSRPVSQNTQSNLKVLKSKVTLKCI